MKNRFLLSILAIVFCGVTASFGQQPVSDEVQRHMVRAQVAEEMAKSSDEYDSAIKEYQEAIRLEPSWPDPYYKLGHVQERSGKLKEAIASYKTYLRLSPNAPDAVKVQEQIYKLEYKVEQILTVPEIINILISLSDTNQWENTGNCTRDTIVFQHSEIKNHVSVATSNYSNYLGKGPWYDSVSVNGATLEYRFNTKKYPGQECVLDPDKFLDICMILEVREVEVVSKTLVRVKQKILKNVPVGRVEEGIVAKILECTYRKK
jgi:tetratricopeptide (TPR) repeat protein